MTIAKLPATIPELLEQAARRFGDLLAWTIDEKEGKPQEEGITFREAKDLAAARRRRIPGEGPIALLLDNSPEWVINFLAVAGTARPVVLVDPSLPPHDISRQLQHAGTEMVITDDRRAEDLRVAWPAARDGRVTVLCTENIDSWPEGAACDSEPTASDVATIMYTSGPVREPRGVVLTHGSLVASAARSVVRLEVGPGDVMLALPPLAHILGLVTLVLSPLAAGFRVVFLKSPRPTAMLKALRHDVTTLIAPPAVYQLLVRRIRENRKAGSGRERRVQEILRFMVSALGRLSPALAGSLARCAFRRTRARVGPRLHRLVSGGAKLRIPWPVF